MASKVTPFDGSQAASSPGVNEVAVDVQVPDKNDAGPQTANASGGQQPGKFGAKDKMAMYVNKACFFTISDLVEDKCRVRLLNVVAFSLVYVFAVFAMIGSIETSMNVTRKVVFSNPPPRSSFAGRFDPSSPAAKILPPRSQKIFAVSDTGAPMVEVDVNVNVEEFRGNGPLPCSSDEVKERKGTLLDLRYHQVCSHDKVEFNQQRTDQYGQATLSNFRVLGPTGLYKLRASVNGVESKEETKVLMATPVMYMETVDPSNPNNIGYMRPPTYVNVRANFTQPPQVILVDENLVPLPNRTVIAFANPDPTWPPTGPKAMGAPQVHMRGEKIVELSCAESLPSDERGIAKFPDCFGVKGANVNNFFIVFSESGFVFRPWHDMAYSPQTLYPVHVRAYRYPTFISTPVEEVQLLTGKSASVLEGEKLDPAPEVIVKDAGGNPLADVPCYATMAYDQSKRLPKYFRNKKKGVINKEILHGRAVTGSNGVAKFTDLRFTVKGNIVDTDYFFWTTGNTAGDTGGFNAGKFKIAFICDGKEQKKHATDPDYGGEVVLKPVSTTIRIKRFIRKSVFLSKYYSEPSADGSDTFLAVVRVLDANGKGVSGKNVQVKPADSSDRFAVDVVAESWEATNDVGFAVLPFRFHFGDGTFLEDGKQTFSVKFIVDGVTSVASEPLTARLIGNRDPSQCQMLLPFFATSLRLKFDVNGSVNDFETISSMWGGKLLEAESGNAIVMGVKFVGQINSVCVYHGNSSSKPQNATACSMVTMLTGFRMRRLLEEDLSREEPEEASARALSGATGSDPDLVVNLEDTFSTDFASGNQIPFQPEPFLRARVESNPAIRGIFAPLGLPARMPTVGTVSQEAMAFMLAQVSGPSGLHLLHAHAQIDNPVTGQKEDCYSPPVPVMIYNLLEDITVEGDSAPDHYALTVENEAPVNITLQLHAADNKQLPDWIQLSDNFWAEKGIQFRFEEAPYQYHEVFKMGAGNPHSTMNAVASPEYLLDPRVCSSCDAGGYDKSTGKLHLQFKFRQRGIFGKFGIKFHGFGIVTRVFTWTQKPPRGIKVEVIREPIASPNSLAGDKMLVTPRIKVTDGEGKPVEGTILAYQTIPEPDSNNMPNASNVFTRLTDLFMFSPLPFLYTSASGAADGVAAHDLFTVLDGYGCARFVWNAGEGIQTEVHPKAAPLCFTPGWDYTIVPGHEPPASMPIGMAVKDIQGASFQVEARSRRDPANTLASYFGFFLARIMVVNNAGAELNDFEMFGATLNQLEESVCIWYNPNPLAWGSPTVMSGSQEFMKLLEGNPRCTDLQLVQSNGTVIVRFKWQNWKWSRLVSEPGKMKVTVGDLSTSQIGYRKLFHTPLDFTSWPSTDQYSHCMEDATESQEILAAVTSPEIKAEVDPSSFSVVLPPPENVEVGSMFLVRIKLLTASGGPVPARMMRVGIKQLSSTTPSTATPDFLQNMAQGGNNLDVVKNAEVELDAANLVRKSKKDGTVTFPISVARGTSGTYALEFQPEKAGSKIVLQTAPFKLINQIVEIEGVDSTWTDMEVEKFGVETRVTHKPSFKIVTASGATLENLTREGTTMRIRLILKAFSTKVSKESSMVEAAKQAAAKATKQQSASYLQAAQSAATASLKAQIQVVETKMSSRAIGMFSGFKEEYADLCLATPAAKLQSGDAAEVKSLNNTISPPMVASTSEAVANNPDAISPAEQLGMFTDVLMSGGNQLKPKQDMSVQGEWQLTLDSFTKRADGGYQLQEDLYLAFQPNMEYKFVLAINGVAGRDDSFPAFKIIKKKEDPIDVAFSWFCSSIAAILTVILLTTNTVLHPWWWFLISILCTVGLMVVIPFLNKYRDAMNGNFLIIAYVNLGLILVGLVFGLLTEFMPGKFKTFATKRKEVFEKYARRKTMQLFSVENHCVQKPGLVATMKKTFLKPFDEEEAFYFPSNLLIAMFLAFMSWLYVFVQSLHILQNLVDMLEKTINKAVESAIGMISQTNNMWYQNTGTDLPDEATDFQYKQIDLLRKWFHELVDSLHIGAAVGITLASIITVFSIVSMFIAFRHTVLQARKGIFGFKLKNARIVYAATFIGVNISSTIIGYLLITFLVTLIMIPFTWSVVQKIIWNMLPTILSAFVLPQAINILSKMILKKCLFENFFFKTRAGGSIFFFYQTVLAIAGGVIGAIVRFVLGLVGVLCLLPATFGANTPELFNEIYLLDSSYRTYLAAVYCHCTHNNPILITAADRLLNIKETKKDMTANGKHWTSTKSLLILILMRFPHLRQYRKSVLQEKKDLLEAEKKLKKLKVKDKDDAIKDEGKEKMKVQDAWIQNGIEGMNAQLTETSRRLEACKRYQLVISNKPDSPEAEEAKQAMRRVLGNVAAVEIK